MIIDYSRNQKRRIEFPGSPLAVFFLLISVISIAFWFFAFLAWDIGYVIQLIAEIQMVALAAAAAVTGLVAVVRCRDVRWLSVLINIAVTCAGAVIAGHMTMAAVRLSQNTAREARYAAWGSNLPKVYKALRLYADEHDGRFPDRVLDLWPFLAEKALPVDFALNRPVPSSVPAPTTSLGTEEAAACIAQGSYYYVRGLTVRDRAVLMYEAVAERHWGDEPDFVYEGRYVVLYTDGTVEGISEYSQIPEKKAALNEALRKRHIPWP